jgi:GNAT superfamily N-acetyltransferase
MYKRVAIEDIADICDMTGEYPMVLEYLDNDIYGDEYYKDIYEWWEYYESDTPSAILCIAYDKNLPNSIHLSVFEIAKSARGNGLGTEILNSFDRNFNTRTLTLQARDKGLKDFYTKRGFKILDAKSNLLKRVY